MSDFIKDMEELTQEDQKLVLTFLQDMRISYDPDWVTLTDEERKELEEVKKEEKFINFEELTKELKL